MCPMRGLREGVRRIPLDAQIPGDTDEDISADSGSASGGSTISPEAALPRAHDALVAAS